MLPGHTPKGQVVAINRVAEKDPEKCILVEAMKVGMMRLQVLLQEDDYAVVNGLTIIFDLDGYTLGHFTQIIPLAKKLVLCLRVSL